MNIGYNQSSLSSRRLTFITWNLCTLKRFKFIECTFTFLFLFSISAVPGLVLSEDDDRKIHETPTKSVIYESDVFKDSGPVLSSRASLTAEEILARVEVAKLGEQTSGGAVDIQDVINAGELNEDKMKEIGKALVEKHMIESVDLENRLRESEIKDINFILNDVDAQKKAAILEIQNELKVCLFVHFCCCLFALFSGVFLLFFCIVV